jgi:hypothetical protein
MRKIVWLLGALSFAFPAASQTQAPRRTSVGETSGTSRKASSVLPVTEAKGENRSLENDSEPMGEIRELKELVLQQSRQLEAQQQKIEAWRAR